MLTCRGSARESRALPNVPIKYQRQALDAYARWWPSNSKAGRHRQRDARLAYSL
jgi:hypothetical protein